MKNIKKIILSICVITILAIVIFMNFFFGDASELKAVKSEKELEKIYKSGTNSQIDEIFINIIGLPFSLFINSSKIVSTDDYMPIVGSNSSNFEIAIDSATTSGSSSKQEVTYKDYSTTNIQVENVDEADITKTDGDYIYSISESDVVITNVIDSENIKISAKINSSDGSIPEDLILYKNKLVVIANEYDDTYSSYYYSNNDNTLVKIYDITNKEKPELVKHYKLHEPYYTSRCIDNKLYVIASGSLRKNDDDKIETGYMEDYTEKNIALNNIQYLKDIETRKQTLISMVDLDNVKEDIQLSSYLIDISNAYVSENNIYLLDQEYERSSYVPPVSSLFGVWGAIGPFKYAYEEEATPSSYYTKIYKFNILEDGSIRYSGNTKTKGKTINQYSVDEYNENLRLALYDSEGSRVVIFDKDLKEIGKTSNLAKGETMYSSRFMGNKAYLVTYKTIDPLYVIDLSDETNPKVLGELKIPGYSTYLHPYDENHLIGIGMETEEVIRKDSSGKVISTTSNIIGMKMALFDISNVNNPIQISSTVIGDRRTTSAILTNPKALLFSKEKELIAIPVNNYAEDFNVSNSSTTYSSVISSYTGYQKSYIAEGYAVYKINIQDGFKLKGMITHENTNSDKHYYSYGVRTKLLRGIYIDNNLYTISENQIKINDLETLELVNGINVKTEQQLTTQKEEATTETESKKNITSTTTIQ